jgi:hypothetical protein
VVAEGDRHTLTVDLSAVAAPVVTPSPVPAEAQRVPARGRSVSASASALATSTSSRTPQWLLLGTGGALVATAAVTGLMALDADAEFEEKCPELRDCDSSLLSLQERTATLSTATDLLLLSGGLALGGALLWLLLADEAQPSQPRRTAVDRTANGAGLELRVRF